MFIFPLIAFCFYVYVAVTSHYVTSHGENQLTLHSITLYLRYFDTFPNAPTSIDAHYLLPCCMIPT
jgi:hypothetical protein